MTKKKDVRYAVVGLGHIAQVAVLPAFEHAKGCTLAALVSDDRDKLAKLGKKYGVERRCTYAEYDGLLASEEIDAVYIALPNHMHRDYTVRACQAGIHVLCEKPLAVTSAECQEMIDAADQAGVLLMTAYRLHFEKATLRAIELVHEGKIGEPRFFSSEFGFQVREGNIRVDRERGGGALYDIGVYCINAARMLFRDEPIRVSAMAARKPDDPRFEEVAETIACTLAFPDNRLAQFTVSFGCASIAQYRIVGTEGHLAADGAYEYAEGSSQILTLEEKKPRHKEFPKRDQFAAELDYFASCIRENREPEPNGQEGLLDVRIVEALHRSIREQRVIDLEPLDKDRRPTPSQQISKRPVRKPPKTIHAEAPHA